MGSGRRIQQDTAPRPLLPAFGGGSANAVFGCLPEGCAQYQAIKCGAAEKIIIIEPSIACIHCRKQGRMFGNRRRNIDRCERDRGLCQPSASPRPGDTWRPRTRAKGALIGTAPAKRCSDHLSASIASGRFAQGLGRLARRLANAAQRRGARLRAASASVSHRPSIRPQDGLALVAELCGPRGPSLEARLLPS